MQLSDQHFQAVTQLFQQISGIKLNASKRSLVQGRLQKLALEHGLDSIDAYVDGVMSRKQPGEIRLIVDRLTTNETYFYREPEHFEFLADWLRQHRPTSAFRVWSAASSSGEEAHTIAMVLAEQLSGVPWEIVGTDLSSAMIEAASQGLYPMERVQKLPAAWLKRYCLKGSGEYSGQVLVDRSLRSRIRFQQANLTQPLPDLGQFDIIFLRNVLIYFDDAGKRDIVQRVLTRLRRGGLLFTGHAESLSNLQLPIRMVKPAIYAPTDSHH